MGVGGGMQVNTETTKGRFVKGPLHSTKKFVSLRRASGGPIHSFVSEWTCPVVLMPFGTMVFWLVILQHIEREQNTRLYREYLPSMPSSKSGPGKELHLNKKGNLCSFRLPSHNALLKGL